MGPSVATYFALFFSLEHNFPMCRGAEGYCRLSYLTTLFCPVGWCDTSTVYIYRHIRCITVFSVYLHPSSSFFHGVSGSAFLLVVVVCVCVCVI